MRRHLVVDLIEHMIAQELHERVPGPSVRTMVKPERTMSSDGRPVAGIGIWRRAAHGSASRKQPHDRQVALVWITEVVADLHHVLSVLGRRCYFTIVTRLDVRRTHSGVDPVSWTVMDLGERGGSWLLS